MKKLYLSMALPALFLGVVYACLAADEPDYEGKPLSHWLRDLGLSGSRSTESLRQSQAAVRALGTSALPVLLQRISATNFPSSFNDEIGARYGFEALGPLAKPAIPQLIELLRPRPRSEGSSGNQANRGNRSASTAADALHAIGSEAWAPLTNALASGEEELRRGVLPAIASFSKEKPEEVGKILISAVRDPLVSTRFTAVQLLGRAHLQPAVVVPALMEAARDTDSAVRYYAFQGLGNYGPEARAAVPLLLKAARNEPVGHGGPVGALEKIDPTSALNRLTENLNRFTEDLSSQNATVRVTALRALREFGLPARPAMPALLHVMESNNGRERLLAASALRAIGPEALPGLVNLMRHTNADVRFEAVRTISLFETNALSATAELAKLRDDPDEKVRRAAISVAKKLTAAAEKANAPFKSNIVRRPVRVPADDRKEQTLPVDQLERQVTAAIAKLQKPDTRIEGFCELVELQSHTAASRSAADSFAASKIVRKANSALHADSDLAGLVTGLESRLKQAATRMEALRVLLKFMPISIGGSGFSSGSGDAHYDEAQRQAGAAVTECDDIPTVEKAMESPDRTLRWWAVMKFSSDRISQSEWERLAPKFKKIVAEDDAGLRAAAAERLGWFAGTKGFIDERLQAEASPDVLMHLLQVRRGRVGDDYYKEFLVLFRPLLEHEDERIRHDALLFIGAHANPARAPMWQFPFGRDVCDRVLELTRSPSVQERYDAAYALRGLKRIDSEQRREALLRLMRDTNSEVRYSAGWGLAPEKDRPEVANVLRGLLTEPSPSIRYSATLMLGQTNYVKELQELSHCPDERVAEDARRDLERINKQHRSPNAPALPKTKS